MAHETVYVEEVTSLAALTEHWPAWRQLRDDRLEDNIYSSPEFVLAGLRSYAARPFNLAFIYRGRGACRQMIGCAPFEAAASDRQPPLRTLRFWSTPHSYLSQPLLHRDHATEAAAGLWDWLAAAEPSNSLVSLPLMGIESSTWQAMSQALEPRGVAATIRHRFDRPALLRCRSFNDYLASLPAKRRKNYRRCWRALNAAGEVEVRHRRDATARCDWTSRFVRMEALGWKGERGSALACSAADVAFFEQITRAYGDRADLFYSEIRLDGVAVAMSASFVEGTTLFGFKVAFDPRYRRYSPGVLNAVHEARLFLESADLQIGESGANARSFIGSYWRDSTPMAEVLLPGNSTGRLAVAGFEKATRAKRGARVVLEALRKPRRVA